MVEIELKLMLHLLILMKIGSILNIMLVLASELCVRTVAHWTFFVVLLFCVFN